MHLKNDEIWNMHNCQCPRSSLCLQTNLSVGAQLHFNCPFVVALFFLRAELHQVPMPNARITDVNANTNVNVNVSPNANANTNANTNATVNANPNVNATECSFCPNATIHTMTYLAEAATGFEPSIATRKVAACSGS